jgi:beta-galactosidase
MLYGASYYHEYQPFERLELDLDLMIEAGFTTIRVGESTWSSYEPEDGVIAFDALETVIDAAVARGLSVIVGTPTYAVPPWLARKHPQVMAQISTTQTLPYGGRQNVDFTDPTYRRYAERIIRAMGERFGSRPGVIGFQVDNEIGVYQLTNPPVVERFRREVAERLGGIDGVNEKWGLTYWSQRLSTIDDLWAPDGNTNPGYALEWSRFQSRLTVEFLTWQRDILREYVPVDRFIFHDVVGGDSQGSTALREIATALDQTAVNVYLPMQAALQLPEAAPSETTGLAPWWLLDAGPSIPQWKADLAYSLKGPRGSAFAITEAQAGSIGDQSTNAPPFPGQLRLLAHLYASRGADFLAYWHWHTLHYGNEMFWGGVLGHDLEPGRIYREVAQIGADLEAIGPALEGATPDSDVAILYSRDSLKALEFMPSLLRPGTAHPDPNSYHRVFMGLYSPAVDDGVQVRVVHDDSDWAGEKVLLVPALYVADDELLDRLIAHADAGAHVVVTFRSGYSDEWVRARWSRAPGPLRSGVGASYEESTTLVGAVPLTPVGVDGLPPLELAAGAVATAWADLLTPESAEVLAEYDDPFLGDYAAITTQAVGQGRMTWVGTLPDSESSARIVRWALAERRADAVANLWGDRPPSLRITSALRPDGLRLWFVANHGWGRVTVRTPGGEQLTDLVTGTRYSAELALGAWESLVLRGD